MLLVEVLHRVCVARAAANKVYVRMQVLSYFLFILLQTLNCWLEEITYLVTMATSTWTLPINHTTMDILSRHVYKGIHYHYNQNDP